MKRVAFAYISALMDFTSEDEARKYKRDNYGKGWWFGEVYENCNDNEFKYSMEVRKPYGKYNPGF